MPPRDNDDPAAGRPAADDPDGSAAPPPASLTRRRLVAGGALLAAAVVPAGAAAAAVGGAHRSSPAARRQATAAPRPDPGPHVQAVVSAHGIATDAGLEILALGGSAADAAVAVAAALSVVEPFYSSALGGETWALFYDAVGERVVSLDGVGPVGGLATIPDYAARADTPGIHQAIVPGAWDGWMVWLERFGRLDLVDVLAPAIRAALRGFPVSAEMARWLAQDAGVIAAFPDSARTYLRNGQPPRQGDTVRLPELAATFDALARAALDAGDRAAGLQAARDYVYRGPIAEAMVAFSDANGGYFTADDFAGFEAQLVEPIAIDYRGLTVYEAPPNSQGIAMLLGLNILKGFDFAGLAPDDPDVVHLQVEALKLAFADRYAHVGDPARVDVPVAELLSDEHAARQRERIDPARAAAWPIDSLLPRRATNTTTFHVVDREGNAAAVTTSLGAQFLVIGNTGIHINNRMRFLALDDGDPNQLTPGYKVRHTSNPYLALRDGRPYLLGGNTGVDTQPQGQLQQFMAMVEFGLGPQEAVARPRFVSTAFPATTYPYAVGNTLQMENGFPPTLVEELRRRGHDVVVGAGIFGSANALVVGEGGRAAETGAEPRSEVARGEVVPAAG